MSLNPLYWWLFLLNSLCLVPWTYGPLTFICLIYSIVILANLIISKTKFQHLTHSYNGDNALIKKLFFVTLLINLLTAIIGITFNPLWIIDIAQNTYAATDTFTHGLNPYTHTAQLWVRQFPENTPHMENINGQITMFGQPYFYGYPYFPLMMLSYLPSYYLIDGFTSIRLTHIFLIILNVWAFKLLFDQLLPNKQNRNTALVLAMTAYLAVFRYNIEVIALGVTDILISTYLLFCFVALSRKYFLLAGIFLGLSQACKLLPSPFVFLGILSFLYGQHENRQDIWRFIIGFILACGILILPFFFWHPQGFTSATILYYLTHHEGGDQTSLWYFLPKVLQPSFSIIGLFLTLGSILFFYKINKTNLVTVMAGTYASYAIFMSFSKMSHLNYLWSVWPLGCFALAYFMTMRMNSDFSSETFKTPDESA